MNEPFWLSLSYSQDNRATLPRTTTTQRDPKPNTNTGFCWAQSGYFFAEGWRVLAEGKGDFRFTMSNSDLPWLVDRGPRTSLALVLGGACRERLAHNKHDVLQVADGVCN